MQLSVPSQNDYEHIVSRFLKDIGYFKPSITPDLSLEKPVTSYFGSQPWEPLIKDQAVKRAKRSAVELGMIYPFVSKEHKIACSIFITYMFLIDDCELGLIPGLEEFETRLIQGKPQESPVLTSMLEFLGKMGTLFGSYGRIIISKSMVEFIGGRLVENRYEGSMVPPVGALRFPQYFRRKASIADPFAHFAFPQQLYPEEVFLEEYLPILPDAADFVSFSNDIISFYKETMTGVEDLNYICNFAHVRQISLLEALRITSEKAVQCVRNIRAVLSKSKYPELLDTTELFLQSYVACHFNLPRYKLGELDIRV